jgi:hypothetical protein
LKDINKELVHVPKLQKKRKHLLFLSVNSLA